MASASKAITFNVVAAPSWWTSLADKTWFPVSQNNLEDVRPSGVAASTIRYVMEAWNGACVHQARKELILAACGGHGNYGGNEVYAFNFLTRLWTRKTDPSSAPFLTTDTNGIKTDGTPASSHTYQNQTCAPNGKVYLCMLGSTAPDGNGSNRVFAWNRENFTVNTGTRGWSDLGLAGTGSTVDDGLSSYDPVTNRVFFGQRRQPTGSGQKQFASIDCTNDSITTYTLSCGDLGSYPTGVVVYRGSTSVFLMYGPLLKRTLSCQSPTALTTPTFSGSVQPNGTHGGVYLPGSEQVVSWRQDTSDLLVASAPATLTTGTYAWSVVSAAGGTPSASTTNGTYNRFNVIHDMGDGRTAIVLVNSTSGSVYVYKVPVAGL